MKTSRRHFIQASALGSLAMANSVLALPSAESQGNVALAEHLDPFSIAGEHIIEKVLPGPTYFEGMLLGNGDVGVCVVVRPDALVIHISKTDCWDIRVTEGSEKAVKPFSEILEMWKNASEEAKSKGATDAIYLESGTDAFRKYSSTVGEAYHTKWPRPWPCGTVWLSWDTRWVRPVRYSLNPSNGLFQLELSCTSMSGSSRVVQLSAFVDWQTGLISVQSDQAAPVTSVEYSPEVDGFHAGPFDPGTVDKRPGRLPWPELTHKTAPAHAEFSCFQYLPAIGPTKEQPISPKSDHDRNFSLHGQITGRWSSSLASNGKDVILTPNEDQNFRLDLMVVTPRDVLLRRLESQAKSDAVKGKRISIPQTQIFSKDELDTATNAKRGVAEMAGVEFSELQRRSEEHWRDHWSRSAVAFADKELERIWYHNQYFLACCLKKHRTAPGLFANWSAGDIGTAWHSDYHLDYNCQQVYWAVFSSNHVDMHQPFVELCENLMPMSEKFARDSYGLPGAFFPLSAFPVPSQIVPYPVPPWGYQVCMTPWAVQSLWWEYLYTQDDDYLRYVYPMMRAAALFVAAYLKKGQDQRYNVIPSISSENWGFTVDYRLNKNCILDLSLISFLLDAVINASAVLNVDRDDRVRWSEIRNNLAKYPTGKGPYGEVWLDVEDAPVEHVYNVPITLAPVFPGEQVGIGIGKEHWEIAVRTAKTIRLEGGNDLVSQPFIRARLKMLDLAWFKEQVRYCKLPNEMSNDRVRQVGGRYSQSTDFDFMMRMGIWCENFALPAVLNECMLQSYTGVIRLFPNTQNLGPSRFENLRAVGAYLVSASHDGKSVTRVTIYSEKARQIRMESPWPGKAIRATCSADGKAVVVDRDGEVFTFATDADATYSILPD